MINVAHHCPSAGVRKKFIFRADVPGSKLGKVESSQTVWSGSVVVTAYDILNPAARVRILCEANI